MNQRDWLTLYLDARERYPGMVLLLRNGEAYETFGTDAETVGNVCGLSLFPAHHGQPPWAGFPDDMLEGCLRKLLHAGHRVAICDQIEPAALPKRVEVSRIVILGNIVPDEAPEPQTLFDWMVE